MGKPDIEPARSAEHVAGVDKGVVAVGRENLHGALPPHDSYEGGHRFDPMAEWSPEEERAVIRKTDFRLLTWLCIMVMNFFSSGGRAMGTCSCSRYQSSSACNLIAAT